MLEISNLTKTFPGNKGVFNLSLKINPGQIVGFLGPNGAGKSTTINCITGLTKFDSGSIKILGTQITQSAAYKVFKFVGTMFSDNVFDENLTAKKTLLLTQKLFGFSSSENWHKMATYLGLNLDTKLKNLSLGNKKKVGIIASILHQPQLAIMDEPTSGLDPIVRKKFQALVKDLAKSGSAIFLSSHDLYEVSQICDRIIMIKEGKLVINETTKNILDNHIRIFRLQNPRPSLVDYIQHYYSGNKIYKSESEVIIYTNKYEELLHLLHLNNFTNFYLERPTLEEMFEGIYN